jgi:hypothetical protein
MSGQPEIGKTVPQTYAIDLDKLRVKIFERKNMKSRNAITEIEETVLKKTSKFFKDPSSLQIAMDKESFKRTPELLEHFKDGKFFSSVPAAVFFGFSGSFFLAMVVIIAYLIS